MGLNDSVTGAVGGLVSRTAVVWKNVVAGYPGGYKSFRRGTAGLYDAAPFEQPDDPNDLQSRRCPTRT